VRVRRASASDAYALWIWANDEATRAASFTHERISWDGHVRWLAQTLASDDKLVLIAESHDAQPLGSVRFDTVDAWRTARLSYVVAPESRGRGVSRPMIEAALRFLSEKGPVEIHADVLRSNDRSARVFRALGWSAEEREDSFTFVAAAEGK
jgi:RimJ/RimL family protein N-acetyltransferase